MGAGVKAAEHMIFSTPCENQPWLREHPYGDFICADPTWDKWWWPTRPWALC